MAVYSIYKCRFRWQQKANQSVTAQQAQQAQQRKKREERFNSKFIKSKFKIKATPSVNSKFKINKFKIKAAAKNYRLLSPSIFFYLPLSPFYI